MSDDWYKRKEVKPDVNQYCLIYVPGEGFYMEYYDGAHFSEHHSSDVTHWQPLPEPPQ